MRMLLLLASFAATPVLAEQVEIALVDRIDGDLEGYCLDISGGLGANADPARGLQAHTCYSYRGALEVDQIFETDRLNKNTFYMPNFEVCASVPSAPGSSVSLETCSGDEAQQISLQEDGSIRPVAATGLCFTVGEETRLGRGGTSRHQIKSLTLAECAEPPSPYQVWRARTGQD